MQEALLYIKNNLIDADSDMYLTVNSLIEINIIKTDSNNITLKKVYVMPYGFDKIYIDKKLIADRLYQIIDQFNDRKIISTKFDLILLNKILPFYDRNGRTCEILFVNDNIRRQNI